MLKNNCVIRARSTRSGGERPNHHRPWIHRASHKLMYLTLKYIFCLCRQRSVGCEKYKCYNNGRCEDTCDGDMFYCHCTELYRGKQCERFKGTRPDAYCGYCLKYRDRRWYFLVHESVAFHQKNFYTSKSTVRKFFIIHFCEMCAW